MLSAEELDRIRAAIKAPVTEHGWAKKPAFSQHAHAITAWPQWLPTTQEYTLILARS
jgi:hypothetical protein